MKKEINRVLGNSLRCILPSFWWKRLLGMLVDKIESAESSASSAMKMATLAGAEASDKQDRLVSGSNIKTINHQSILGSGNIIVDTDKMEKYKTKDDLDANGSLAGGDIAAVVDALLVEKPFTECYQPTRSEIEANPYNAKFTKVDGISLNPDFNPNLISSNCGSLRVVLYSDGKSKGYYKEYPSHLEIECDYNRRILCWEHDGTSGTGHTLYDSAGFNASNIDRVNDILREGDFRFSYFEVTYRKNVSDPGYTYYYSYNGNIPSDATATIDSFVKMLFAETQNADIYVRSAEWVKLLKEGDVTGGGADITIDSELSDTSTNAVQNKVVKGYVDKISYKVLDLTDVNSHSTLIAALKEIGLLTTGGPAYAPPVYISKGPFSSSGWVTRMDGTNSFMELNYETSDGTIHFVRSLSSGSYVAFATQNAYVSLNTEDSILKNRNKQVFSGTNASADASTFRVSFSGKYYTPVYGNANINRSTGICDSYDIVVYRNNQYETWVLSSDGSSYLKEVNTTNVISDSELSETSENAVQNKVVTAKLASLEARIAALEGK